MNPSQASRGLYALARTTANATRNVAQSPNTVAAPNKLATHWLLQFTAPPYVGEAGGRAALPCGHAAAACSTTVPGEEDRRGVRLCVRVNAEDAGEGVAPGAAACREYGSCSGAGKNVQGHEARGVVQTRSEQTRKRHAGVDLFRFGIPV